MQVRESQSLLALEHEHSSPYRFSCFQFSGIRDSSTQRGEICIRFQSSVVPVVAAAFNLKTPTTTKQKAMPVQPAPSIGGRTILDHQMPNIIGLLFVHLHTLVLATPKGIRSYISDAHITSGNIFVCRKASQVRHAHNLTASI